MPLRSSAPPSAPAGLAWAPKLEPGQEVLFCPVRKLPIQRDARVRTIPGFHILSLDAGKEALARGSYKACGDKDFSCTDLQYLHPDDKVFTCEEDGKQFLNEMSLHYHRYIRFELEERKEERKRLRERAAERKAKRDAVLNVPPTTNPPAKDVLLPSGWKATSASPSTKESAVPAKVVKDPYVVDDSDGDDNQADPLMAAAVAATASSAKAPAMTDAPEMSAAEMAVFEALKQEGLGVGPDALSPPHEDDAPQQTSSKELEELAMLFKAAEEKSQKSPEAPPPKRARTVASSTPAPAAAALDMDDLYGDIAGPAVNKSEETSTYASKIGSMLNADDFDEDE